MEDAGDVVEDAEWGEWGEMGDWTSATPSLG